MWLCEGKKWHGWHGHRIASVCGALTMNRESLALSNYYLPTNRCKWAATEPANGQSIHAKKRGTDAETKGTIGERQKKGQAGVCCMPYAHACACCVLDWMGVCISVCSLLIVVVTFFGDGFVYPACLLSLPLMI